MLLKKVLYIIFTFIFIVPLLSNQAKKDNDKVYLNLLFYNKFKNIPVIHRDDFLENKINSIVQGFGVISSIGKKARYKKRFRVILLNNEVTKLNLTIKYYIYISNKETISMLAKNEVFEFSGQLVAYTPLNLTRDSYVLDIILEKGAILIK